jgi:hypothetical protein
MAHFTTSRDPSTEWTIVSRPTTHSSAMKKQTSVKRRNRRGLGPDGVRLLEPRIDSAIARLPVEVARSGRPRRKGEKPRQTGNAEPNSMR